MKLPLITALNRARLRRRVAIQHARRQEMRQTAFALLAEQDRLVEQAERDLEQHMLRGLRSDDIAREIDRKQRAGLLSCD